MDKIELLGFLLQNLRDDHMPDEEDIDPSILRETTKIYDLIITNAHLTRDMFDVSGLREESDEAVDQRYAQFRTTNYPINFVVFADTFADWLMGEDERDRLTLIDLIAMIKEFSSLRVKIVPQPQGSLVVVRSNRFAADKIWEEVLVTD